MIGNYTVQSVVIKKTHAWLEYMTPESTKPSVALPLPTIPL